jgi:hypothetical protein
MNEKNTKKKTGKQAGHSSRTVMWKKETRTLTWMSMPAIVWYLLFCYLPMFGIFFAFKEFKPVPGDSLLKNLFVNRRKACMTARGGSMDYSGYLERFRMYIFDPDVKVYDLNLESQR